MRNTRIDPASVSHNIDLSLLNNYLDYVLKLEDLHASAKNDILKVVECFKFIKVNLDFIAEAISLQIEFPRLIFSTDKDHQNGVIRDFFHTSLHIANFQTSEQGLSNLSDYVSSFEEAIKAMEQHKTILEFTEKITYDKHTGCLENRTVAAFKYCAEIISRAENPELSLPDLDKLFEMCSKEYSHNTESNHALTYQFFSPYLNQPCHYNKHVITITHEIITDYLVTILGQELNHCELKQTADTPLKIALHMTKNVRKKIGFTGMVQLLFPSYAQGQQFVVWLKTLNFLQLHGIEKAQCDLHTNIVRLNETQYNALFGFLAYQNLQNQYFNLDLDKPIQKSRVDAKEFFSLAKGNEQKFITFIDDYTPQILAQALQYKRYGRSVLHQAAQHQSPKGLLKLLHVCAGEALDSALVQQDIKGHTPLKIAACYQPAISFTQLLRTCSQSALNEALSIPDSEGWNALESAAHYQSDLGFKLLIEKLSSEALANALGKGVFTRICNNQSIINVARLILKLNKITLEQNLTILAPSVTLLASLDYLLIKQKMGTPTQLQVIIEASQTLFPLLFDSLFHHYLKGKAKPVMLTSNNVFLSKLNQHQSNAKAQSLLRWINSNKSYDNPSNCYFNNGQLVDLTSKTLAQQIYVQGIKDWKSLRILNQHRSDLNEIRLLDILENNQLINLTTTLYNLDTKNYLENDVLRQLRLGQVVVKIFSNYKNFSQHIQSLKDANFRIPNIRMKKSNATTKWVHRNNEFIPYPVKVTKQDYLQAQKTSVTLISKKLNTRLFNTRSEDNTPCVGIAYKADAEKDKAWLLKDRGTYMHDWVGSFNNVRSYAQRMTDINFTDYSEFQRAIDNQPQVTNEILTHLNRDRVLAIIIGIDSPTARELAERYRQQVKEHLHLDIPIIFYNSRLKHAHPLSDMKGMQQVEESIGDFSWTAELFTDFAKRYEVDKNDCESLNNLIRMVLKKEIIKQIPMLANKYTGKKAQLSNRNTFFKIPKGAKCILDILDNPKLSSWEALQQVQAQAAKRLKKKCALTRSPYTNSLYSKLTQFYYFTINNDASKKFTRSN